MLQESKQSFTNLSALITVQKYSGWFFQMNMLIYPVKKNGGKISVSSYENLLMSEDIKSQNIVLNSKSFIAVSSSITSSV